MSPLYRCIVRVFAAFFVSAHALHAQPGALDPSLDPRLGVGGADKEIYALALQPNGKIIIGGSFTTFGDIFNNEATLRRIARLNSDGLLDNTFRPGTGADNWVSSLALKSNGKIIIGGYFTQYNGVPCSGIARLNADGSLDNNFLRGLEAGNVVNALALQPDGKIIVGGAFITPGPVGIYSSRIYRLNANGSLDNSFRGSVNGGFVQTLALQPDGKILIGGDFIQYNGTNRRGIARLNSDGSLDNTFRPGTGADNRVNSLALQSDGKIIIGGYFTQYNGVNRSSIARLNADGSLDNTFTTVNEISINAILLQPDGKVIVGGSFYSSTGAASKRIARLNANGSLDNTFNPSTGANQSINALARQPDGKVLISGNFTRYNGALRNRIARVVGCAVITVASAPLPNGTVGTAYSQTLPASGGSAPYSYTVSSGTLPAGITLSAAGVLSGTPTVAGTSAFTVRATDVNGCSGEVAKTLTVEPAPAAFFAYKVQAFAQGKTKQGGTIEPIRSNPRQALGPPQENDTYNFVSLGFGGSITLELAQPLYDTNGYAPDFILVETTFGPANQKCYGNDGSINYPETALIQVSADSLRWVSLPDAYCRTSFIDIGPAIREGLAFVRYIRIRDASNQDLFSDSADGFDLDGIIVGPDAVAKGLNEYTNARLSGSGLWDAAFYNRAPNEATPETRPLKLYPNPASGSSLTVEYVSVTAQPLDIRVYNAAGVRVRALAETAAEGINAYTLDVSVLAKGLYLIQVRTGGSPPVTARFIRH